LLLFSHLHNIEDIISTTGIVTVPQNDLVYF
jgi:hypothetical protein